MSANFLKIFSPIFRPFFCKFFEIENDILTLTFVDTGTHADIFKL